MDTQKELINTILREFADNLQEKITKYTVELQKDVVGTLEWRLTTLLGLGHKLRLVKGIIAYVNRQDDSLETRALLAEYFVGLNGRLIESATSKSHELTNVSTSVGHNVSNAAEIEVLLTFCSELPIKKIIDEATKP